MKKTMEDLKEYLLENFVDEDGDLNISRLDFTDFDGDVIINNLKVKGSLQQDEQEVKGDLHQDFQNVEGDLFQQGQEVGGDLHQHIQEVRGNLIQDEVRELTVEEVSELLGYKVKIKE